MSLNWCYPTGAAMVISAIVVGVLNEVGIPVLEIAGIDLSMGVPFLIGLFVAAHSALTDEDESVEQDKTSEEIFPKKKKEEEAPSIIPTATASLPLSGSDEATMLRNQVAALQQELAFMQQQAAMAGGGFNGEVIESEVVGEPPVEPPMDTTNQNEFDPVPPPSAPPIEDAEWCDLENTAATAAQETVPSSYGDWLAEEDPPEPPPEDAGRNQH